MIFCQLSNYIQKGLRQSAFWTKTMMLNYSNFNLIDCENDELLIYNTYSGAIVKLNKENSTKFLNKDFKNIEYLNDLLNMGFLVEDSSKEIEQIKKLKADFIRDNHTLHITILPTTKCNCRCVYCFETIRNISMSQDTISKMIDFIKQYIRDKHYTKFHVTWFGGEPLYDFELFCSIYNRIEKLASSLNIELENSIITNGTLLNKNSQSFLQKMQNLTSVQITIDGCKEIHDMRRPLLHGSSFDALISNIKDCTLILPICIRINVDKTNYDQLETLIKYLATIPNLKENSIVYFARVHGDGPYCYSSPDFSIIRLKNTALLKKYKFKKSFKRVIPTPTPVDCIATTPHSLVFDADGAIYSCIEVVGNKSFSIGTVQSGIKRSVESLFSNEDESCIQCSLYPICHEGCPISRKKNIKENCIYDKHTLIKEIRECVVND